MVRYRVRLPSAPNGHVMARCLMGCAALGWVAGSDTTSVGALAERRVIDPGNPWQRGSKENTNGLLRQYFPRAPTSPHTDSTSSPPSLLSSTAARAKRSAGKPQPSASLLYFSSNPLCCDDS
jgi:hypothetical protein